MRKKGLLLAAMVCSTTLLALATTTAPHVGLLLLGLGFLGIAPAGIVTLIGILLAVGSLLKLLSAGPQGLADQLLF